MFYTVEPSCEHVQEEPGPFACGDSCEDLERCILRDINVWKFSRYGHMIIQT